MSLIYSNGQLLKQYQQARHLIHTSIRQILRKCPLYVDVRRWQRDGFGTAIARYALWRQILQTSPVKTATATDDTTVEVHLLCYRRDYLMAMWALKSFYHFAEVDYPLAIHVQGILGASARKTLQKHFPQARLLHQDEVGPDINRFLAKEGLRRLLHLRNTNPFMMKIVDFNLLTIGKVMLALDSDLLFFRKPREVLDSVQAAIQRRVITLQKDYQSTYNIDAETAMRVWNLDLPEKVNSGVIACRRDAVDLAQCEDWLQNDNLARSTGWIEQTLYALSASGRICYLPETYLVSRLPNLNCSELVMRHYAGDTRSMLTSEGLPYLIRTGFLRSLAK